MSMKNRSILLLIAFLNIFIIPSTNLCLEVNNQKRAIIFGASVGMGREISKLLAADGYIVGLVARRLSLLQELQQQIPTLSYIKQIDVARHDEAIAKFEALIQEMGGLDLLIICTTGYHEVDHADRHWIAAKAIFDVDIISFYGLARTALNFFEKQGHGHLVGFSSIDGLRGIAKAPVYSAAKAFCSRYMEAERNYFIQKNIPVLVTDIIPGWINSAEVPDFKQKYPQAYWFESLEDSAQEIFQAIKNKVPAAYITKRWEKVAEMIKIMPDDLYNALGGL
jgi:short-subunit dehydrogenase